MHRMLTVLVVEPDDAEVALLRGAVERRCEGARIERARTVAQAAAMLAQEGPFDAALVSDRLPDGSAEDLLMAIGPAAVHETPIVVVTATDDEARALRLLGLGAQDCLDRAMRGVDQLCRAIRFAMERRWVHDHRASAAPTPVHGASSRRGWANGAPPRGTQVGGRFEVCRVIGRGGMGVVCEARDLEREGVAVALKLLDPIKALDPEVRGRFEREAAVTLAVRHTAVVGGIIDGEADDGAPFLALELVRGPSLLRALRRVGPLVPGAVRALGERLALGLGAIHAAGVIHRDLKPANVVLPAAKPWLAKILDFGVAHAAAGTPGGDVMSTGVGAVVGSPTYMAPEQAASLPVDHRVDLYALGITLYECLTGAPPFEGPTPLQVLYQHVHQAPEPPSLRTSFPVPVALENVVLSLLEKRPEDRPASALAVASALRGVALSPHDVCAGPLLDPSEYGWSAAPEAPPSRTSPGHSRARLTR